MPSSIASKPVYSTVGQQSLSGTNITLRLVCAKIDARTIFDSFVDGAYYTNVGDTNPGYTVFAVNGWCIYSNAKVLKEAGKKEEEENE